MSQLILVLLISIALASLPVMFAARIVGAERTGFLPAVVAVLVQLVASALTSGLSSSIAISAIVSIIVGSFVYAFVLGTTFLKGLFIGIVALVITVIVAIVFGGSLALLAAAASQFVQPEPASFHQQP